MFLLILLVFIFSTKPALSQNLVSQYLTDLSYQQDLYNQSYNTYLQKKVIHQQYNSIATEKELINIIKQTISHRNSLLSSYLNLIIAKLDIYKPQDNPQLTSTIQSVLNQQNLWLKNQHIQVTSISNQSQLIQYNQQFSQNYSQIEQYLNNALIQNRLNHQNQIIVQIKNLLLEIKASPKFDNQAQNWVAEIEFQLDQCLTLLSEAVSQINTDKQESYRTYSDAYQIALPSLEASQQNLHKVIDNIQNLIKKFS